MNNLPSITEVDNSKEELPEGDTHDSRWFVVSWKVRSSITVSLALGICTYVLALLATEWQILGLALGTLAACVSMWISYLYRRRGKLSLLTAVFGLPTVCGVLCWGWNQLDPYHQQSRAYRVLSQANVKFKATTSGVDGEWVRDNQAFFPLWLAKLAGKHSTTSIHMLSGELEDLQFPTLYSLELNSLAFVEVHKSKNSPDLSPRLIEWLASCPKLYSLKLTIDSLREADNPAIKLLGKLDKIQHFEITLNLDQCDEQVDLAPLPKNIRAFVTIQELNPSRASQLRGIRSLRISTQSVSVNAVAQLSNVGVWLNGCKFDGDSASAISEISARGLILESCTFPERFVIASKSTVQRNLGSLSLIKTHIEPEMLTQWLSAANVTNIDLRLMLPEPLGQLAQRLRTIDTLHKATYSLDGSRTETIPLKP